MAAPFWHELRRRHVFRVAAAYGVTVWLLLQLASIVLPTFGAPPWVLKVLIGAFVLFFPVAILFGWAFELTPEGMRRTQPAESPQARPASHTRQVGRRLDFAIIAVLAIAVAVLAWRLGIHQRATVSTGTSAPGQSSAKSIAVLPFANDSGDPQQRYFSDGLAENLIIALSKYPNLVVIGRSSSFQMRDTTLGSQEIGKKLGVAYLLEGSVGHDADEVRVRAELVDAQTGRTLWSNAYDRPYQHLFELQDELTEAVTTALAPQLLGGLQARVDAQTDRPPSGNLEAYNAYLEGNFYAQGITEKSLRSAIPYYRQAVALDRSYAAGWAGLSEAWMRLGAGFLGGDERRQAFESGQAAVETALKLAPDLALAHIARGFGQLCTADWRGAEASFRRALELTPSSPEVKQSLCAALMALGRFDEALGYAREAVAASALDPIAYYRLTQILVALDRPKEAHEAITKAISLRPGVAILHTELTTVEILLGDPRAAIAAAESEPDPGWRSVAEALAFAAAGDTVRADQVLQKLISTGAGSAAYQIAEIYAFRKQPNDAFAWLDRAWQQRDPGIATLLADPFLRAYRDDPRFVAFCEKAGLPLPAQR